MPEGLVSFHLAAVVLMMLVEMQRAVVKKFKRDDERKLAIRGQTARPMKGIVLIATLLFGSMCFCERFDMGRSRNDGLYTERMAEHSRYGETMALSDAKSRWTRSLRITTRREYNGDKEDCSSMYFFVATGTCNSMSIIQGCLTFVTYLYR